MWYKNNLVFDGETDIRYYEDSSLPVVLDDALLLSLGYTPVTITQQPVITDVQTATQSGVNVLPDGSVETAWVISDMFVDTYDIDGTTVLVSKLQQETDYIAKTQADAMLVVIQHFTDVTTNYIQDKINAYNLANGVAFKDIDSFAKYALLPTSIYYAVALQFMAYADRVWTAVRAYQATATVIPTDTGFTLLLDSVIF